jgi:chorismate mutase
MTRDQVEVLEEKILKLMGERVGLVAQIGGLKAALDFRESELRRLRAIIDDMLSNFSGSKN